ncbi:MAG: transporter [Gemmatimonadales bacterium]
MRRTLTLLALLAVPAMASAQASESTSSSSAPPIQDNSFLVEEAYNQEAGVVQHITTFHTRRGSSDFDASFTQEWPFRTIRHQLSFDIPISRTGSATGIGDVGINYRYQLTGDGDAQLAVAPRITLILPTGDWKRSRGNGAVGVEANLPVSYVLSPLLVTHLNVGASHTPSARNSLGERAGISEWFVAQSVILIASQAIQPMLEAVYSRGREVTGEDATSRTESFLLSPGLRAAFNFASGPQIVPGIAVPLGLGPSKGERGVFFYLSLEHSFTR